MRPCQFSVMYPVVLSIKKTLLKSAPESPQDGRVRAVQEKPPLGVLYRSVLPSAKPVVADGKLSFRSCLLVAPNTSAQVCPRFVVRKMPSWCTAKPVEPLLGNC